MGLFDGIEKLITEHGSAAILKERIALVQDQYAALEKKLADSELRAKEFESEKLRFELENFKMKEKIKGLEEQLSKIRDTNSLEEVRERILLLVSQHENITSAQAAGAVGVGEQLATFHLTELEKMKFIQSSHIAGSDWAREKSRTEWYVMQPGRSYLVNHSLIK
jgi:Fic family protein